MVQILPLVFHPDDRLRLVSTPINPADIAGYAELVADMSLTMEEDKGIGLAAPQIGQNIRLITVLTKDGPFAMFNPRLEKKSRKKEWGEEGCLSIPHLFGQVERHKAVSCAFLDAAGQERLIEAEGLMARVIQHEIDHLDGILFIDTAKDLHNA